jgi:predicted dehydrogenase
MKRPLRVGIVGASAGRGWARISHVPAVQQLEGVELQAVVGSDPSKAEAAARAFGAEAAYGSAKALFLDPNVDLVSICVKVPDHRDLALGALAAGKHLYCEWPLGRDVAEADELAAAADAAGVHAAVGLQARMNRTAQRARDLIASGAIGRPLSARLYSSTMAFGPKVESAMAFAEQAENGATLVTIQGAHTLDLAIAVLGEFKAASALTTTQYPEVEVGDDATQQARLTPDHLLVQARLAGGGALSVEVVGGRPPEATPFRLEVTGEEGELVLEGGAPRGFQSGRLRLWLNGERQRVNEGELAPMPEEAVNVAGIYAALRDDISNGTPSAPDFHRAARLTRLIDDLISSAETGTRKSAADWPVP